MTIKEYIWRAKYRQEGENSLYDTYRRVANYIAKGVKLGGDFSDIFFSLMNENRFIPGGRILANAGTKIKNLGNCFVLSVRDSRESIFKALADSAQIFAWGGGIGYNFSHLREKGAPISIGGESSGVLSFMKLFDDVAEVIKIRSRRGAMMGQLDVSHPEIRDFIRLKSSLTQKQENIIKRLASLGMDEDNLYLVRRAFESMNFNHFNISVRFTNDFFEAVLNDGEWRLISPLNGKVKEILKAKELLDEIAYQAWASGDPGFVFLDRINQDELMYDVWGPPESSNPCSELYLYPYESCVLGSINLLEHTKISHGKWVIDWPKLAETVFYATIFLDAVVEMNENIVEELNRVQKYLRRIGLGVMGWADLLLRLEIPYGSEESLRLAKTVMWFITMVSVMTSNYLARKVNPAPFWEDNKYNLNVAFLYKLFSYRGIDDVFQTAKKSLRKFIVEHGLEEFFGRSSTYPLRNVSWTSLAPTGSISILAGVSQAIEPYFKLVYKRNVELGEDVVQQTVYIRNAEVDRKLREDFGISEDEIVDFYDEYLEGGIENVEVLPKEKAKLFVDAQSLPPKSHIDMQAALQEFTSNSISKTVNLPKETTPEEIRDLIIYMWRSGIKSSTVYRDGSKLFQILE